VNGSRGRPFEPGNTFGRGRPKGSKNKKTNMAQETLEQYAEPLIKKTVATALEGDKPTLRFCVDRLLPARGERGVRMKIPKLDQIQDIDQAQQKVLGEVAKGNITPSYGEKLHVMFQNHRDNLEGRQVQADLAELERRAREVQERTRRR
jgi:hypothetical protein